MKSVRLQQALLGTWILWTIVLVGALTLTRHVALEPRSAPQRLEAMVPMAFGGWRLDPDAAPEIVDDEQQGALDSIYGETLTRTYLNPTNGHRIMVSLAYGRDQSRDKKIHRQELCYTSQGFVVDGMKRTLFHVAGHGIPVTTLHARRGTRSEYVSYWMIEGNRVVRGAMQQDLQRTVLALQGVLGDGLLFRVSEISSDEESSISVQRDFADALVRAVEPGSRERLVGSAALEQFSTI